MAEPLTEPKGRLALDMGWRTAAVGIIGFGYCLLATVSVAWTLLTGAFAEVQVSWQTVLVVLFGAWLMIEVRERTLRFGLGLLVLASGSRLMLAALHASAQIQILNGQIMRAVDLVVMAGLCVYIAYWFKQRIKRV
jgi:hypothetical protein